MMDRQLKLLLGRESPDATVFQIPVKFTQMLQ